MSMLNEERQVVARQLGVSQQLVVTQSAQLSVTLGGCGGVLVILSMRAGRFHTCIYVSVCVCGVCVCVCVCVVCVCMCVSQTLTSLENSHTGTSVPAPALDRIPELDSARLAPDRPMIRGGVHSSRNGLAGLTGCC